MTKPQCLLEPKQIQPMTMLNADLVTAQDLIDFVNNEFEDPSQVYLGSPDSDGLVVEHRVNDMGDGSYTHDLLISVKHFD